MFYITGAQFLIFLYFSNIVVSIKLHFFEKQKKREKHKRSPTQKKKEKKAKNDRCSILFTRGNFADGAKQTGPCGPQQHRQKYSCKALYHHPH